MWLEEDDEAGGFQRARGLERGGELGGVVAVVIDEAASGGEIFRFETALGTGEGREGAGDEGELRAALIRDSDCGE